MTHLSLIDICRKLHEVGTRHDEADNAETNAPDGSRERKQANARLRLALEQDRALHDLALTLQPSALDEAAVQLLVVCSDLARINDLDLAALLQGGDLERDLARFERALKGVARVVCQSARINPRETGPMNTADLFDSQLAARDRRSAGGPTPSSRFVGLQTGSVCLGGASASCGVVVCTAPSAGHPPHFRPIALSGYGCKFIG